MKNISSSTFDVIFLQVHLDSGCHGESASPTDEPVEFFKEHELMACDSNTRLSMPSEPVAIGNGRARPGSSPSTVPNY